jgi:hypothetical protein
MAAGSPGRGRASASRSGTRPVPLILPSAPRQFGESGDLRPGGSRSKTSPFGVGGRGGRGSRRSHHSLRAEGSTAVRPDGVLAKDNGRDWRFNVRNGCFIHVGTHEESVALVCEVAIEAILAFRKGSEFTQTRWRFGRGTPRGGAGRHAARVVERLRQENPRAQKDRGL